MATRRPAVLPGKALITALVVFIVLLARIFADSGSQQERTDTTAQSNNLDILSLSWVITAQFLHASTSDIFPTTPLSLDPLSSQRYKLDVCSRSEIAKCMYYGNASNGLPANLQGIWWTDGIGLPTLAFSTLGPWEPWARKLRMGPTYTRAWAYENSSSELVGLLWTVSGASDFASNLLPMLFFDIYLDEHFTFGQLVGGFQILGFQIFIPTVLLNFQMEWLGDETWKRKSSLLFLPVGSGNYKLKRAVTGEGKPGRFFGDFLKYKGPSGSSSGLATPVAI
eukprot:jgi/Botrbrau1/1775/Bobra.0217s0030.1